VSKGSISSRILDGTRVMRQNALELAESLSKAFSLMKVEHHLVVRDLVLMHSEVLEKLDQTIKDSYALIPQSSKKESSVSSKPRRSVSLIEEKLSTASSKQDQIKCPSVKDKSEQERFEEMLVEMQKLSCMFRDFELTVVEQQEKLDAIEDNVITAYGQVEKGESELVIAARHHHASLGFKLAAAGGLVGASVVGGPLLAVGAGTIVVLAGTTLGAIAGGKALQALWNRSRGL